MVKKYAGIILIFGFLLAVLYIFSSDRSVSAEPLVFRESASLEMLSIDDKIDRAEIIIIGRVEAVLPAQWGRGNEKDIQDATSQEIFEEGMFTDAVISIDQILKGEVDSETVRVRSFIGETEDYKWVDSSQPVFEMGKSFLLFIKEDMGPTSIVDPGYYVSVNSGTAVYEIDDGMARSLSDEWDIEELIAYIQNSFSVTCEPRKSTTEWISAARTINELTLESDLIVHVRVSETPVTQVETFEVSVMNEHGNPTHTTEIRTLYSHTVFEVLKTYMGESVPMIAVRQTGGFDASVPNGIDEMMDDPLYKIDEEYILFLVNFSDENVNINESKLYHIVNPYGRYGIYGERACSFGEFVSEESFLEVHDLEAKIETSVVLLLAPPVP